MSDNLNSVGNVIDESLQEGFIPLHIAAYNTITNINENNEKIINNEHEISKLIKALPKDIAALDKRSVLANVNSQGSGT